MTDKSASTERIDTDALIEQFHHLRNASTFTAKDEAVKFGALVVAAIRRLDTRLAKLEESQDGS